MIPKDDLNQIFSKWAERNGFGRPMTSPIFFRRLFEHGEHVLDLKPNDRATIDMEPVKWGLLAGINNWLQVWGIVWGIENIQKKRT